MAITRSHELRHSSSARDTKSSSRVIVIIIRSLNNIHTINLSVTPFLLILPDIIPDLAERFHEYSRGV
jgi:hypothetical protein